MPCPSTLVGCGERQILASCVGCSSIQCIRKKKKKVRTSVPGHTCKRMPGKRQVSKTRAVGWALSRVGWIRCRCRRPTASDSDAGGCQSKSLPKPEVSQVPHVPDWKCHCTGSGGKTLGCAYRRIATWAKCWGGLVIGVGVGVGACWCRRRRRRRRWRWLSARGA